MRGLVRITILAGAVLLAACGGPKEDQLRTVKSYEFATCDSTPTADGTQLEAIRAFKSEVQDRYFIRRKDSVFAANHESTADASGVREYEGPFYIYVHPRNPDKREAAQGVEWASTVFLHADKVRSRVNGQDWSEWNSVRTRNFGQSGPTVEGLGRWMCLLGAEIAWAEVTRANGTWTVTPVGVSVYDAQEIRRALPLPAKTQIEGEQPVEAL